LFLEIVIIAINFLFKVFFWRRVQQVGQSLFRCLFFHCLLFSGEEELLGVFEQFGWQVGKQEEEEEY